MRITLFILLIVAFTVPVNAQTSDKKWGMGTGAGAYGTLNNGGIGILPELYFSRYLSPRFDLMFQGNLGVFRSTLKTNDLDFKNLFLNLRIKLSNETKNLRPYLYAGPGLLKYSNNNKIINFNVGLGTKYYFTPGLAAYFEAGYIQGLNTVRNGSIVREKFWKNTAGLEFNLGKSKDSDMDGVPDNKDKCPNTPLGVAVDKNGCPLDSDGDGVADYLDDCPTVAGLSSLKGCPDEDGDGIADKYDKCPGTKKGVKVDASGCPLNKEKDVVAVPKENSGYPVKEKEVEKKKPVTLNQIEIQNIKVSPVHFVSGKSYLTDYSKAILDKLVIILNEDKDFNCNIFGYADEMGSEEYNIILSGQRIGSTIEYMGSKGISDSRFITRTAFGKANPVATNATPEGRLINRRVEFEIVKMK